MPKILRPKRSKLDANGHAVAVRFKRADPQGAQETVTLAARTVLVAAGTQPNTVLGREDPINVRLDGKHFQAFDESGPCGLAGADKQTSHGTRVDE